VTSEAGMKAVTLQASKQTVSQASKQAVTLQTSKQTVSQASKQAVLQSNKQAVTHQHYPNLHALYLSLTKKSSVITLDLAP
jgi:hypothetical protein